MLKYQTGMPAEMPMNPEILSQMMSAQGAGQGVDFNGNPTPNISGEPSFADMYQEIKTRYDKLIEPLEKRMKQLQIKLQENPTDTTIKNELSRIESKIDKLEQQEDMEIQQLEAEVEQSGQQIEQKKQIENSIVMPVPDGDAPEYQPLAEQQMLQEAVQPSIEEQMPPMEGVPTMQLGGMARINKEAMRDAQDNNIANAIRSYFKFVSPIQMAAYTRTQSPSETPAYTNTYNTTKYAGNNTAETTRSEKPQWWQNMVGDLKERPLSDYVQIGTRAGELSSDYAKRMANVLMGMKKSDNPYPQYIDRLNRSNDELMKANEHYYNNMESQAMRDANRAFNTSQFASLQGKFAANEAVRQKSNDLLEKIRAERQREDASTRAQHESLLYNAFKDYSSQRENNEMFGMNNTVKAYETMNRDRNDKLKRIYEMADLFSDASQDQRDYNFLMGPWSNNYKMFSTMRNFLSRLTPEDRQKLLEDLETTENQ